MRPLSRLTRYSGYGDIWLQHSVQSRRELWSKTSRIESGGFQHIRCRIAAFSTFRPLREIDEKPIARPTTNPKVEDLLPASEPAVRVVPEETLPSHREGQRWVFSKRTHALLDDLMQRLSVAGQEINKYTGTDYTPIEALRQEIKEQEQLVRARQKAISTAKAALDTAIDQRTVSQKSVVALLERKSSWSASDLESYMSLIRSEHAHDQAIEASKDAVAQSEQALEEARARLEKRERAQYHEEQIWSDTIRRNSSWITFGLMGVNFVLLVLNLVAIEPWRRNRMVKEIKSAMKDEMEAKTMVNSSSEAEIPTKNISQLEELLEPTEEPIPEVAAIIVEPDEDMEMFHPLSWEGIKAYLKDPFDTQLIGIQKRDLTRFGIQAVAAGTILTSAVLYIFTLQ